MRRIVQSSPEHEFLFLFDRAFSDEFIYGDNVWAKVLFPQARHPLLYRMYFEYSVPKALKQWNADLFFSPDGFLSLKTRKPQIPVIHDINFEHRPEDLPKSYANYYRNYFPQFAQRAKHILTVSDYSANDMQRTYGIESSKISVAHNGKSDQYQPQGSETDASTRKQHTQGLPYFVFVGNFSYRKNIHGIISAYNTYRSQGGQHRLLMVGDALWRYNEMDQEMAKSEFADDIIFTGRLELPELIKVVSAAEALLFPSYFEGFGIPVLESMAAGTPVICSDCTSLPEVAGDAALFVSPDDNQAMANHMLAITSNKNLRQDLVKQGLIQSQKFSWDQCANKVKSVLFS